MAAFAGRSRDTQIKLYASNRKMQVLNGLVWLDTGLCALLVYAQVDVCGDGGERERVCVCVCAGARSMLPREI